MSTALAVRVTHRSAASVRASFFCGVNLDRLLSETSFLCCPRWEMRRYPVAGVALPLAAVMVPQTERVQAGRRNSNHRGLQTRVLPITYGFLPPLAIVLGVRMRRSCVRPFRSGPRSGGKRIRRAVIVVYQWQLMVDSGAVVAVLRKYVTCRRYVRIAVKLEM